MHKLLEIFNNLNKIEENLKIYKILISFIRKLSLSLSFCNCFKFTIDVKQDLIYISESP